MNDEACPPDTFRQVIHNFDYEKAVAYFEGAWRGCRRDECRRRRRCAGGPRGTLRRLLADGAPVAPACRVGRPALAREADATPPGEWD